MKKTLKVSCLGISLFFLLTGVCFGDLIGDLTSGGLNYTFDYSYKDSEGNSQTIPWAQLHVDLLLNSTDPAGTSWDYQYIYTLTNIAPEMNDIVNGEPFPANLVIHMLAIPIASGAVGYSAFDSDGISVGGTEPSLLVPLGNEFQVTWFGGGVNPGNPDGYSTAIRLWSSEEPQVDPEQLARIVNTGNNSQTEAAAPIFVTGGGAGGDPTPEPTTLLLLGSGLLGAGILRKLRYMKK